MSGNHDYEALIARLRDELTKAEEVFRLATTPESKSEARDRFGEALDRYSRLLLHGEVPTPRGTK